MKKADILKAFQKKQKRIEEEAAERNRLIRREFDEKKSGLEEETERIQRELLAETKGTLSAKTEELSLKKRALERQVREREIALAAERNETQKLSDEVSHLAEREKDISETISEGEKRIGEIEARKIRIENESLRVEAESRKKLEQMSQLLQDHQALLNQQNNPTGELPESIQTSEPREFKQSEDIRIKFLGTVGEGVKPRGMNRKNPGILIEFKGKKLMLDCGEEEFLGEKPDWIFLSHAHDDHVKGLLNGTHTRVYLTQPTLEKIKDYPMEDITIIKPNKRYELDEFSITTFETTHSIEYPTIGFKITIAGKTIVYTSDMLWVKNYKEIFKRAFLLIGDGSAFREDYVKREKKSGKPIGHANLLKIYRWARNAEVRNIVFTNLGPWIHKIDPIAAFEDIDASPVFDGSELTIVGNRISAVPAKRIETREGPPKGYPTDSKYYCDSLNWKFPTSNREFTAKAYEYFKERKNYTKYSKIERNYIRDCIRRAWKKFGISDWQEFSKGRRWVIQSHWRGSSEHKDLRFAMNDHLVGFTLADQEEDVAKELVGSHWKLKKAGPNIELYWDDKLFYRIEKKTEKILVKPSAALEATVLVHHKRLEDVDRLWKVDWKGGGEEKKRPAPKGEVGTREKIWSSTKATQPKAWLKAEGVTLPRAIEKAPGGTEFYPGIFVVVDKGIYYPGAMKPYFMEFFPRGKKLTGRIVLRLVPGLKTKKLLNWLYWKPTDQIPYVLGKRAVKENWLPKEDSALPPEWEAKIPGQFKYWNKTGTKAQLLARAQAVNHLIEKEIIKERRKIKIEGQDFRKGRFLLTERSWKGPKVVRGIPVTDFHLKIDGKQFHLTKSPLWKDEIPAQLFTGSPGYFKEGTKAPQTELNPNKKIPAFVKIIDSGPTRIIEESTNSIKLQFLGKKLKGSWVFLRTSAKDPIWSMVKSPSPKSFNFMFRDFQKLKEVKTSKDIKFPYTFRGIAFAEGTWHNEFYPWKVIKAAADELVGVSLVLDHKDSDVLDTVGDITEVFKNDEKKWIEFNGILYDTEKGRDTAILIENEKIGGLSARLTDAFTFNTEGQKEAEEILDWQHVAFVVDPEVSIAKVCNGKGLQACS